MNKTEVYDYLAKIYFDKNKTSGKKEQQPARIKRYLLFLIMALPLVFLGYVAAQYSISLIQPTSYSLYLTTGNNLVEINYDFLESSLETQGYTLGLARLDAKGFKVLQFNARALKEDGGLSLKIEIENDFLERASVYAQGIAGKWKTFSISLADFKNISHWNNLKAISFTAEHWNTKDKKNVIYIDGIRFTKAGSTIKRN